MTEYKTNSPEETEALGERLAEAILKEGRLPAYVAMFGEMGVGKTAFTSGFGAYFGIKGVKSPTYTVVNEYVGRAKIFHFDMYRIEDGDDLYSIGYDDYIESDGYSVCEWSENITEYIPEGAITVTIERTSECEEQRKITVSEN